MTEDKKCLNCSRMTVSQDEYILGMQEKIHDLEKEISVLLSCSDCSENKGGYICEKEYNDKCLAQKIEYIKELKEHIEKMKCCGNCSKNKLFVENGKLKCEGNIVASFSSDTKITVCDKWEYGE